MKILVTGSAGFIGGYLVEDLLEHGHDIVGIDNYSKYGKVAKSYDNHPHYKFVESDAKDVKLMKELIADCDQVVGLAAIIGGITLFHELAYDLLAENERILASTFDAAIWAFKNRADQTINYTYDALNRVRTKTRPGESAITYTYDIAGRLAEADNGTNSLNYFYDQIGRLEEAVNADSKTVNYEYNSRGLRTKLVYPDDTEVTYEYDADMRLTEIKYQGEKIAEYSYDELSRRTLLSYGNGTSITYLYDLGDRLTRITNNAGTSIDIQYSDYDKVGNRKNMLINGSETEYTYDKLYQLTFVDYPAGSGTDTTYNYDRLGSRTSVVAGSTTNYLHNKLNQYDSVASVSYTYDAKGNLTNDGTYKYIYDCENRLTTVKNQSDVTIATYSYDFIGRRISKTVSGVTAKNFRLINSAS